MDDPTSDPAADAAPTGGPSDVGPGKTSPATSAPRERRWLVRLLVWGTTVLAVVAIFAVWTNRQLLNPNNWANTSTKLLQNAKIRDSTSNYLPRATSSTPPTAALSPPRPHKPPPGARGGEAVLRPIGR